MESNSNKVVDIYERNKLALNNQNELAQWLDFLRVQHRLRYEGLAKLVDYTLINSTKAADIINLYLLSTYDALSREILMENRVLSEFNGAGHSVMQKQFMECDESLKSLQSARIVDVIADNKTPNGISGPRANDRTEYSLVKHEYNKSRQHIPLRRLMLRAGKTIKIMKPCFMMGPMSVAQYLEPGKMQFDLIIMDEASQIKPEESVGVIARGKQVVIVGDQKQLPPTNFFNSMYDEDADDDPIALNDSESILEACAPMFANRQLRWHYRSQHESLIAFSNQTFYHNNLVVFPSPNTDTDEYGIKLTRVKKGRFTNQRNIEEARAIAEAVREHLTDRPDESLGVVAMSAQQRSEIDRAIETLSKEDMVFQSLLENNEAGDESLFVKNLENVQGDERDVIFISFTYGPQEMGGIVFQRFGPINTQHGGRRLNVLFTRSKKRMHLFSSMGSSDIKTSSTSSIGVQALHDFLKYAETGILHKTIHDTGRPPDSDFEISVIDQLENQGFKCQLQVGVAGFYIDLAVYDPGADGKFLMGIECDGATYHSAKSARDRDRLRQEILERLGWKIRRIWSTDYLKIQNHKLILLLKN